MTALNIKDLIRAILKNKYTLKVFHLLSKKINLLNFIKPNHMRKEKKYLVHSRTLDIKNLHREFVHRNTHKILIKIF